MIFNLSNKYLICRKIFNLFSRLRAEFGRGGGAQELEELEEPEFGYEKS